MLRDVVPKMHIVPSIGAGEFDIRAQAVAASARSADRIFEARPSETSGFVLSGVVSVVDAGRGASVRVLADEGQAWRPAAPEFWAAKRAADALARTGIE